MTTRFFWGGPPTKESLSSASKEQLGTEISNLLGIENDNSIFKLTQANPPGNDGIYKSFLEFILLSSYTAKNDKTNNPILFYPVEGLSEAEKQQFRDKYQQYEGYLNTRMIKSRLGRTTSSQASSLLPLTFSQLHDYNRMVIREHMKDKDYDEVKPIDFLKIFRQRIEEMDSCYRFPTTKTLKTENEVSYLKVETERERIILDSMQKKLEEMKETEETMRSNIIMDELKKMASYIMWGSKFMECYYNSDGSLKTESEVNAYVDIMLAKLREAKNMDSNCVKKLMTFLPLNIFFRRNKQTKERVLEDELLSSSQDDDYEFDFDEDKLRSFYRSNGILLDYETGEARETSYAGEPTKIIKGPLVQYRLGLADELFGPIYKIYSEIRGLFNVYGLDVDLFHSCGRYATYNIYLNLLLLYMQLLKTDSAFPISLSLKKTTEWGILDVNTQSYEFRYRPPVRARGLFDTETKFLGVIFLKYQSNDKRQYKLLPLFIFKHIEHQRLSTLSNTDPDIVNFNYIFFSQYTGNASEILTCDSKLYFVEDGEITPTMSITYHELTNMLYYGAKAYIIGDDRKEIYFTMLPNDNPELQKLVRLLQMTQVFFVKGKIDGFSKERFKVMTKEEVDVALSQRPQIWRLMGNQRLEDSPPIVSGGGYKKTMKNNKTYNSNKLNKTNKKNRLYIKKNKANQTKKIYKDKKSKKNKKNKKSRGL